MSEPRRTGRRGRAGRLRTRRLALEPLEARRLLASFSMSIEEQLVVELINRARSDPAAEAAWFDIDLNEGLAPGTISTSPKQPLAPNQLLINAARGHSQDMVDREFFSHTNPSGQGPRERMVAAGYTPRSWGENIVDGCWDEYCVHETLFLSAGHRRNILADNFREVGIGLVYSWETYVTGTQKFGSRDGNAFLTGVVFSDNRWGDNFLTFGESLAHVTVTAQRGGSGTTYSTTTGPSGGYALQVPAGVYDLKAEGGDLAETLVVSHVQMDSRNVKVDFVVPYIPPEVDRYEVNNTLATATVLGYGDQWLEQLTIHDEYDDDYFRWTAHQDGPLTVELDLQRDFGDPALTLLDSRGTVLRYGEWTENGSSVTWMVKAGESYLFGVSPGTSPWNIHRDYDLTIDGPGDVAPPPDPFEPNDDFAAAADLGQGDRTLTGLTAHVPGDRDVFRWTAPASGPVTVSAIFEAVPDAFQLFLYDAQEQPLDQSQETGLTRTVSAHVAAGDTLLVVAQAGPQTLILDYTLQIDGIMPPRATDDRAMTTPTAPVTIDLVLNDHSDDGQVDATTLRLASLPRHGLVEPGPVAGSVVYTPPEGFVGVDRFTYVVSDERGNESVPARVVVTVLEPANRPWQNPHDARDVNADSFVSPIDALLIINHLTRHGIGPLPSVGADFPLPYYDVNGDDFASPIDALLIINELSRSDQQGEGEASTDLVMRTYPSGPWAVGGGQSAKLARRSPRPLPTRADDATMWRGNVWPVGCVPIASDLSSAPDVATAVPGAPDVMDEEDCGSLLETDSAAGHQGGQRARAARW